MLKCIGSLLVVEEMARARHFYEHVLGQKVKFDFGENVAFEKDFSIHLRSHFQSLLGDAAQYPITRQAHNGELVFEADEIETLYERLRQAAVVFIHGIVEQPWGQLVMRLYDPDGHVLEIGETMEAAVCRYHKQGWSLERIREKTGMPREFIEQAIGEIGSSCGCGKPTGWSVP